MDAAEKHQANEMFQSIGKELRKHKVAHFHDFKGIVHVSISDMQCMSDEIGERDALKYSKPFRPRKIGHGDQKRIFGVRVVADLHVPMGIVEMER